MHGFRPALVGLALAILPLLTHGAFGQALDTRIVALDTEPYCS